MFQVTTAPDQADHYLLLDKTSSAQAVVVPHRGGIITEWSWQDLPILYLDRERFKDPLLSVRGGVPLLFPICGNLEGDSYTHQGKTYQLKQHGFARNLPWKVKEQSTEGGAKLVVELKSNPETYQVYPFEFELNFSYTVKGNQLELGFSHTNLGKEPMPFATGIHPYFCVNNKNSLSFDIPSSKYQAKGDATIQDFQGKFDFDQEEIDVAFFDLSSNSAIVKDLDRGLQLTMQYDSSYSILVFWTVKGKDFYCLEPWSSPRNALNTQDNLLTVPPESTVETKIIMTVESL